MRKIIHDYNSPSYTIYNTMYYVRTLSTKRLGKYLAKIEEADYQKVMAAFNRICC